MLTIEEDNLFKSNLNTTEKHTLIKMQRVFLAYNPTEKRDCLCKLLNRKIKSKQFTEWYDKVRNR